MSTTKIAMFTSKFPLQSTTFIQREVRAFTGAGLELFLVANHRPGKKEYHAVDDDLRHACNYLDEVLVLQVIIAHASVFVKHPLRWLRAASFVLTAGAFTLSQKIRNIRFFYAAGALASLTDSAKITHTHVHFAFGAASVAFFWSVITGNSYSLTIHGSDVLLPRELTREKLEHAKYVISNCHFHCRNLPERFPGLHVRAFHVIRIGLEIASPRWSYATIPPFEGTLRVFAAGRLIEVKAFHLLIDACRRAAEQGLTVHLRLAGEGPLHASLETLAQQIALPSKAELIGPISEDQIAREMALSHVVALTSLSEGTPMCLIEAMAKGRPVIAPEITAIPEVVQHGITGLLFAVGSSENCAEALLKMASIEDEQREAMGREGRRKAEREFDLSTNIGKLAACHISYGNGSGKNEALENCTSARLQAHA